MKLSQPLPRETAKNYALRVLKENIVELELPPGSQISENELSAALSVSRTPIREALSELEKVKLVEIVPQKKTSIALIDYDLVEEASFLRSTLETAVIAEVCEKRTEQDLMRFEQNLAMQHIALRGGALEEMMRRDNEFHRFFFEITRKLEIWQLMQNLQVHFDRVRNLSLNTITDEAIITEHEAIFDSIKRREAAQARAQLSAHLVRYRFDAGIIQSTYPDYFK
ncbi:MAG: GntR family transcriptional regulator [Oscillospiraceae bacterium]|nr:GntR family transcriptional regulator [Oscillospiraceae bacterium]